MNRISLVSCLFLILLIRQIYGAGVCTCNNDEEVEAYQNVKKCQKALEAKNSPFAKSVHLRCGYYLELINICFNSMHKCYNSTKLLDLYKNTEKKGYIQYFTLMQDSLRLTIRELKCAVFVNFQSMNLEDEDLPALDTAKCTSEQHKEMNEKKTSVCYYQHLRNALTHLNDTNHVCGILDKMTQCRNGWRNCYANEVVNYMHERAIRLTQGIFQRLMESTKYSVNNYMECFIFNGNNHGQQAKDKSKCNRDTSNPKDYPCCKSKKDLIYTNKFIKCIDEKIAEKNHDGALIANMDGNPVFLCQMIEVVLGRHATGDLACFIRYNKCYDLQDLQLMRSLFLRITYGVLRFFKRIAELLDIKEEFIIPMEQCPVFKDGKGNFETNLKENLGLSENSSFLTTRCRRQDEKNANKRMMEALECYEDLLVIDIPKNSSTFRVRSRRRLASALCQQLSLVDTCEEKWHKSKEGCWHTKATQALNKRFKELLRQTFIVMESQDDKLLKISKICSLFGGTNSRATVLEPKGVHTSFLIGVLLLSSM